VKTPAARAQSASQQPTPKVFISYSRKDTAIVRRVFETLEARQLRAWVDWEGIPPSAQWWGEIQAAIEGAEAFIFVMSPESLASKVCQDEVRHAVKHNKRLIPLLYRELEPATHPEAAIPPVLARINWIYIRDSDDFAEASGKLFQAIETDLDWVRAHTRLLERAVEWDRAKRDTSFLLQKNDLTIAEEWLSRGPEKDPKPTTLQTEYIISSRAQAVRRRRQLWTGASIAMLLILIASMIAGWQYRLSEVRREEALSRRLVAQVDELIKRDDWDLGLLLGLHANNVFPTAEATGTLLQALDHLRGVQQILSETYDPRGPVALSNDGKLLIVTACREPIDSWSCGQSEVSVLRTDRGTAVAKLVLPAQVMSATFDGDGRQLAISTGQDNAASPVRNPDRKTEGLMNPFKVSIFDLPADLAEKTKPIALGSAKLEITGKGETIQQLSFAGRELLLGQSDQLFTWRLSDGSLVKRVALRADAISKDASTALVLNGGVPDLSGRVELWDIRGAAKRIAAIRVPPAMSQQAAFSGDAQSIVLLTCQMMASGRHCQGALSLINRKAARVLGRTVERPDEIDPIIVIALPPDGRWFVSGGCGASTQTEACLYGRLNFWKATEYGIEEYARPIRTFGGQVNALAFSGDAKTLASVSSQGKITLWRVDSPTLEATGLLPSLLQTQRSSRYLLGDSRRAITSPASAGAFTNEEEERSSITCGKEAFRDTVPLAIAQTLSEPKQICRITEIFSEVWDYAWDAGRQTLAVAGCSEAAGQNKCLKKRIVLWSVRDGTLGKEREVEAKAKVTSLALDLGRSQIAIAMCDQDSIRTVRNLVP
jgi:WD40 repeat protein